METGSAVRTFIIIIGFYLLIYDSIPSKYTKLEESFGGFMNSSLVRFEYKKLPLHTIAYGGTGTGKTYFFRPYLKLYLDPRSGYTDQNQDQNQNQNQQQAESINTVCKVDRDWIEPETGEFYIGFNTCDINMMTSKNKSKFKDSVIVLDDMGDKLIKDIDYYSTEGRHYNIQMIVMCHKHIIFNRHYNIHYKRHYNIQMIVMCPNNKYRKNEL